MKKLYGFIFLLLFAYVHSFAQQQKKENAQALAGAPDLHTAIKIKAKSYRDSIVLRWAPAAAWAWVQLNSTGYVIEKVDYTNSNQPKKEILATIKPYTLEKFKTVFNRNDKFAAVAAQALYGKNFSTGLRNGSLAYADQAAVLQNRHAFALQAADYDGRVAMAIALKWVDKNVEAGKFYSYKIYPAGKLQGIVDTATLFIQNVDAVLPSPPQISEAIGFDKQVELHWNRFQKEPYSGFIVERSMDGKSFAPLSDIPYFSSLPDSASFYKDSLKKEMYQLLKLSHILMDSVQENYRPYYYRIKGINAFSEWSVYSKPIIVITKDLKPPSSPIVGKPEYLDKKSIKIQWIKNELEGDFKGYSISRSTSINGSFELLTKNILDKSVRSFIDENALPHEENFYIVAAIDTAGNQSVSYPVMGLIPDNDPPSAPVGLKGIIDTAGYVHISWLHNKEEDIKGYKVYFANSENQTPSQITLEPETDSAYTDSISLKTLSKFIYYRIVSVDRNNNHSEFSDILKLRKPDRVPPTSPVAGKVELSAKEVTIEWMQSSSPDAKSYTIYRSEKNNNNYYPIAQVIHQPGQSSFLYTDKTIKPLIKYTYRAETVDEDSLHSAKSIPVPVTIRTLPEQPAITTLTATYNSKTKAIQLNWEYSKTGEYHFIIYRGVNGEPLSASISAGKEEQMYTDNNNSSSKATTIQYAIQAIFKDERNQTTISKAIIVSIPVTE